MTKFLTKITSGLWWTIPVAFLTKLAIKANHPNLSAAIGEYIEGALWAVGFLVILQIAIRLGLALWVTLFGRVESRDKAAFREQCAPTPCVESIEDLAQLAANAETQRGTTEEVHDGPSKVKITFVPDESEGEEVEPEFV